MACVQPTSELDGATGTETIGPCRGSLIVHSSSEQSGGGRRCPRVRRARLLQYTQNAPRRLVRCSLAAGEARMNRRLAIKQGSMALVGLGLGACRTASPVGVGTRSPRPARHLAPVLASWDRVLRTTVGLRPHRKSGFVLR